MVASSVVPLVPSVSFDHDLSQFRTSLLTQVSGGPVVAAPDLIHAVFTASTEPFRRTFTRTLPPVIPTFERTGLRSSF